MWMWVWMWLWTWRWTWTKGDGMRKVKGRVKIGKLWWEAEAMVIKSDRI